MSTFLHIDLNVFSLVILLFVLVSGRTRLGWLSLRDKLFMLIVVSTAVCQVSDTLTWVSDGVATPAGHALAVVSNVILFAAGPLPALLWFFYVYVVTTGGSRIPRRLIVWLLAPVVANALVSVASSATGTFFYFTGGNLYHRGPAFALSTGLAFAFMLGGLALTWARRNDLERASLPTLALFPLAPVVGGVLQIAFYGLTTTWSLTTLSLLLVYVNIQDSRLDFDYLTGGYNRRHLDRYLRTRIEAALNQPRAPGFAVLFADIDDFKSINDTYGHGEGDAALTAASAIFARHVRRGDMVARYAGDEFVLILELDSAPAAEAARDRIDLAFMAHNRRSEKPYDISVSIGYCLFDREKSATAELILRAADASMLARKQAGRLR